MSNLRRHIAIRLLSAVTSLVMLLVAPATVYAEISPEDIESIRNQSTFYDPNFAAQCVSASSTSANASNTNTNIDYLGRQVLNDAQLQVIQQNQAIYQQAATQVDIPWQMIAVIHLREHGGRRSNPDNGQGIYQFVSKQGGPYPTGAVDDAEFLRQTVLAAQFIKAKAGSNYANNQTLTASSSPEAIKDTFFSYNGRASAYEQQAQSIGFTDSEGYEGSPYVMNKADAKRDPEVNKTTWGQIKTDGGSISYPANGDYGAFVMYAALTGIALNGTCTNGFSGPIRDRVVALARQELALWDSGEMTGDGKDYHKYSGGASANWCAYFVSWIFNQANYSIDNSAPNGIVAAVDSIQTIGEQNLRFAWHDAAGYTPQPGDIVIQKSGKSHTNIVVAVSGDRITVIGGNQGYSSGDASSYANSKVTQYDIIGTTADGTTGYVSPMLAE